MNEIICNEKDKMMKNFGIILSVRTYFFFKQQI